MRRFLDVLILGGCALLAPTLSICAAQGVSVSVGQPGFYGRLDIGPFPPPPVLYPQPLVIQSPPVAVPRPPLYLRVPPGHAKNWRKHCQRYQACGHPVYFVQERWYQGVYVPHARTRDDRDDQHDRHDARGHGRGHKGRGRWHNSERAH